MKVLAASLLSLSLFSSVSMASELRYLCRSDDRSLMVRVVPSQGVTIQKTDGRGLPSYFLPCDRGTGNNWLVCEETEGRNFEFFVGGRGGVYHGSHKDTYVTCFQTSRGQE
jgi:hypothetical protein